MAVGVSHIHNSGEYGDRLRVKLITRVCFGSLWGMSRVARIVVPGLAHHVTQRGNRGADVFETDADYEAYLLFLKQYADNPVRDVPAVHRHSSTSLKPSYNEPFAQRKAENHEMAETRSLSIGLAPRPSFTPGSTKGAPCFRTTRFPLWSWRDGPSPE